ncbi:hypothetical protein HYH03_008761 [Edaphochlamys debaryana]|uniref:BZIP domain-containing protein n=1 Tax=Edaphochlamys debaryana TaxID=47281 RepID=A0A835XZF6_9CHLO|nr:hypothetical protein HYH03_008761 [Edaphochlamys debaryana]|eukprot:KAG2493098.1 hypothetical protein HYH03_008761 [Edaphochlamys debaryana]
MSGQAPVQQPRSGPGMPQPFTTLWPAYYAADPPSHDNGPKPAGSGSQRAGGAGADASHADPNDAVALQREREQRTLKRKQANRESAKRSKLRRQQAERELHDHAKRVDAERDSLTGQVEAAQERWAAAQAKHLELRSKIQSYVGGADAAS